MLPPVRTSMRGRQDFGSRSARFAVDAVTRTDSIDELFGGVDRFRRVRQFVDPLLVALSTLQSRRTGDFKLSAVRV